VGDRWSEKLSEYLDGELFDAERAALESHLAVCNDCARTLEELKAVVGRAATLGDQPPTADLWHGIAERLDPGGVVPIARRHRRTISLTIPQLAAAAVAAIMLSVTSALIAVRARSSTGEPVAMTVEAQPIVPAIAGFDALRYDAAVFSLERALAAGRDQLDSTTVRVLEENLSIIDGAIADARAALAADPGNPYLNSHLAQTMLRKAALLKQVAALVAASS